MIIVFKNLFNKKNTVEFINICSPLIGDAVSLEKVPDPVFSQKMMGDGMAIIPKEGKLVSPVDGNVVSIFPTKHAIGLKTVEGLEILIHIGLETVELEGKGYEILVEEGQEVKIGDSLANFDIMFIKNQGKEIITPIIITNSSEKLNEIAENGHGEIAKGDLLFTCYLK